jgi:4-hydroxybenzoate polyprenyltransferase
MTRSTTGEPTAESPPPRRAAPVLLAYLQLIRAPNVFTAWADTLMGYALVGGTQHGMLRLAVLLVATAGFYTAGMVLNDVFDVEQDRKERPFRPIPSGRVPLVVARRLGWSLLAIGWLASFVAGWLAASDVSRGWLVGIIGSLLAVTIVAYDAWWKRTWFGPWLMGACRTQNILLAMAVGAGATPLISQEHPGYVTAALAIGLYVVGITWFARAEAAISTRKQLLCGAAVMALGICLFMLVPGGLPGRGSTAGGLPGHGLAGGLPASTVPWRALAWWYVLLLCIAVPIVRRVVRAVVQPTTTHVQSTVKAAIWALLWWDAALLVLDPRAHIVALVVLAFFVPMFVLGRWVYST